MTRQECAATVLGGPTTVLDAGLTARLRLADHGTWIPLRP
jgi:hypothetical protein